MHSMLCLFLLFLFRMCPPKYGETYQSTTEKKRAKYEKTALEKNIIKIIKIEKRGRKNYNETYGRVKQRLIIIFRVYFSSKGFWTFSN